MGTIYKFTHKINFYWWLDKLFNSLVSTSQFLDVRTILCRG